MTQKDKIRETMKTISQASEIMEQFHQNIADLFFLLSRRLSEGEYIYDSLLEEEEFWTSSISPTLRDSDKWQIKHYALPLKPEEPEDPMILLNISIDKNYNELPELWIGVFQNMDECLDTYPFEESLKLIFTDYFGPEDHWDESLKWYDLSLEDDEDGIDTKMFFYRVPLETLIDQDAVKKYVITPIQELIDDISEEEDDEES